MNLLVAAPTQEFSNFTNQPLGGFQMLYTHRLGQSPLSLGASWSAFCYGVESWGEDYYLNESQFIDAEYTFESMIMDFDAVMRIEPPFRLLDWVQPYGEVGAGLRTLSSTFSITDNEGVCEDEDLYRDVLSRDATYSLSAAGGLQFRLYRLIENRECGPWLDLSVAYRNTGSAQHMYRDMETQHYSRTEMLQFRAGITFRMN